MNEVIMMMLYKTLITLTQLLNDDLRLAFGLTEDVAFLHPLKESGSALPANRICVSLVNVERETGGGIHFKYKSSDGDYVQKTTPPWHLNLYVLIAAVFPEKQYPESLHLFSGILSFLQKNNQLVVSGHTGPVSVEPVNLSFQELSNLWSICGGSYYPSVLCKMRVLSVDEQEIAGLASGIKNEELKMKNE